MEVTDSGSIFITENNRNAYWPDLYGHPIHGIELGSAPGEFNGNTSILIAKFKNNPENPKLRIYSDIYKKVVWFKKRSYIKLEFSLSQVNSSERYTYILYKLNKKEKVWEEIKSYSEAGEYSYKDKHVHQDEFNHYKVTAYNRLGEKIAESRIVSVYPPNPYLQEEDN